MALSYCVKSTSNFYPLHGEASERTVVIVRGPFFLVLAKTWNKLFSDLRRTQSLHQNSLEFASWFSFSNYHRQMWHQSINV